MDKKASAHGRALAELGAAKGGKARAKSLTPEQRSDIARYAAEKRWASLGAGLPKETHTGILKIGDKEIPCSVLDNGILRVFSTRGVSRVVGSRTKGIKGSASVISGGAPQLPPFLASPAIRPFISNDLMVLLISPVQYRPKHGGRTAFGYEATLLPKICEVILDARKAGKLKSRQQHLVETAEMLMRGFARVGIIALVDEATGYQADHAKGELTRILEAYIVEELRPWIKTFPDEFFKQIYRLHGWLYPVGSTKRCSYVGKLINKYIYKELPPPVLPELRKLNPVTKGGYRRHKHFQFLTADTGNIHLDRQITAITTIMKVSDDRKDFQGNFNKAFGKPYQPNLPLVVEIPPEEKKG